MISAQALPFTLLIVLVEFTVGGLWVLWASHIRGESAASFVKFGAGMVAVMAVLTFWLAAKLTVGDKVDGYPLDPSYMPEARVALALVALLSLPYAVLTIRESRIPSLLAGGSASLVGLVAVALLAQVFALPTWGYAGTLLAFVVGGLVVGAVSMGMVLGHWYLVTPRLPERPLREMTFFLLLAMGVQALLIIPALALPRDTIANAVDTPILENPFFWMRVGGGLAFPMLLAWMAYDSSGVRAMQSATGLLYIAMALVLSGEVLAKGLLFVSAVPN
ncbi:MAG: hypothetical protein E6I03_03980 [Chloroflexi bacterium]|nr:MAG: hypothetical protein E6I03_03980 [Chloroflexota bacterium]